MSSGFRELFYVVTGEKPGIVPGWLQRSFVSYHLKKSKGNPMWFNMFNNKRSRILNSRFAFPYRWLQKLQTTKNIGKKRKYYDKYDLSDMMKKAKL